MNLNSEMNENYHAIPPLDDDVDFMEMLTQIASDSCIFSPYILISFNLSFFLQGERTSWEYHTVILYRVAGYGFGIAG